MRVERISVVLPVFNERDNIAPCLTGLARALAGVEHEILVCYDFDEDTTLEGIRAMGTAAPKSIRLVKNTIGRGPHNALKAGFAAASGDVVVTTMADLSDPPELIPRMAEKIRAGADVVSGSRYMPGGSQHGGPLVKRTLSRIAGVTLSWIGGVGTHDATSNFRAYSKRFLDSVTIEATAGFEIALELTVKAHLAGRRVDEVPSSWVDRTAGESRFKLWKWLPNYLRWYMAAMRAPLLAWGALFAAFAIALAMAHRGPAASDVDAGANELAHVVIWCEALLGAASLIGARALRGRNHLADLALPVIWLAPPVLLASTGATFALLGARLVVSAILVHATTERARWRSMWRAGFDRCDQRTLGCALLVLLVWASHLAPAHQSAAADLDPSWQQSLGRALRENLHFGSDILFTYGPLGYFLESPYDPHLYWTKTLFFELVFKLIVSGFLVACAMRLRGSVQRAAFLVAVTVPMIGNDAWALIAVASIAAWLFARPERSVLLEWTAIAVLVVLSLVKFTFLLFSGIAVVVFAVWCWRTRGLHRALRTPALFLATIVIAWAALGQSLLDLPLYVWTSLAITRGYSEAMGHSGAPGDLLLAAWSLGLFALIALIQLVRRGVLASAELALVLVLGLGAFLAFKAGFVRSFGNAITMFAFVGLAPLLLAVPGEPASGAGAGFRARSRGAALVGLRVLAVVFSLYAYGVAREHPDTTFERLTMEWGHETWDRAGRVLDPARHLGEIVEQSTAYQAQVGLPRVREIVGDQPVDLIANTQGVLHANRLTWRPRPAFQSYVAYTPELLERNARFLESARAPKFILFQFETIDDRYPAMDDTLALQVLSRDWRPVLEEGNYILLERRPDAIERAKASKPALEPRRETQMERELAFGDWLDVGDLDGRCHLLFADIRMTALGKLCTTLFRAPQLWMEIVDSEGRKADFRIVPSMLSTGVLLDPFMISNAEWMRWFEGGSCAHVRRLRIHAWDPDVVGRMIEPMIGVRVVRADDLVPPATSDIERAERFPMLPSPPTRLTTHFPWYPSMVGDEKVLVVHAPSDMIWDMEPGRWRIRARYGILAGAWETGLSDGVNFAVVVLDAAGKERIAFKRLLNPRDVEADRSTKDLDLEVVITQRSPLYMRTRPGPAADATCDWAWWTGIRIERVGDVERR